MKTTFRRKDTTNIQEIGIDLFAVPATSDKYLVGECKFKGRPFSHGEYLNTAAKLSELKEKAYFYYYLFSESGFDEKIISEAEENNKVKLICIEEAVNK